MPPLPPFATRLIKLSDGRYMIRRTIFWFIDLYLGFNRNDDYWWITYRYALDYATYDTEQHALERWKKYRGRGPDSVVIAKLT